VIFVKGNRQKPMRKCNGTKGETNLGEMKKGEGKWRDSGGEK
jgi:hypothetical protein